MPEDPKERIGAVVAITIFAIILFVLAAVAVRLVRWVFTGQ